jgi:hypothetical protein
MDEIGADGARPPSELGSAPREHASPAAIIPYPDLSVSGDVKKARSLRALEARSEEDAFVSMPSDRDGQVDGVDPGASESKVVHLDEYRARRDSHDDSNT